MGLHTQNIGSYTISHVKQAEYVNPIEFHFDNGFGQILATTKSIIRTHPDLKKIPSDMAERIAQRLSLKRQEQYWKEDYNEIMNVQFPDGFFNFLNSRKRKEQNKILEKHKIDVDSMLSIFYKAWLDYGFSFSSYHFEKRPKEFAHLKYPDMFYLKEDGTVDKVGTTDMSDGQLIAVLKKRSIVIAKFLDKGNLWHCFLHTVKGITGQETGNMPHIHYISSAFGKHLTRAMVLEQLSKGKYELPRMIHIPFDDSKMKQNLNEETINK